MGVIQTSGDLIDWHSHVHAIVSEGLLKRDGFIIRVVQVDMERCVETWREKVFDLRLREKKVDEEVVRSRRQWPHSGFSIDNSVRIKAAMKRGSRRFYGIADLSRLTGLWKWMTTRPPPQERRVAE